MRLIDMHCDTIYELFNNNEKEFYNGDLSVNIEKMKVGGYTAQFFATFFELDKIKSPYETANLMIDKFLTEIEKNDDLSIALCYKDILKNNENEKISAILTIEEGEAIEGNLSNIEHFYKRGVRLIGLTWNFENSNGYPHCHCENLPLKDFGKKAVESMNHLGIIVDVSHLSDRGFNDVYEICKLDKKPFVASHSNSRELTNHSRNLTDDMIRKIGELGGVIGLNFASDFLGKSDIARVEDMILHLKHIKNKGGIEVLALGSDFDGIPNEVEIKDASYMQYLEAILSKNDFSHNEIEKIMYKNSLRIIKDVIG
ncbi:dipeptidase [Clostridium cylindrosporum]|uniref:Dipeptidase family protein n=1 Tax=Clostridium cylindrosporum DSM 605 TaxID=1121307 RepID=A0A0J8D5M8_CLOCY|nr:dipeptidase [Clostridium cylindrosporum]KMT21142.1 dipeptidase family protein [Clostridium cylindrosporum DSM 605]